MGKDAPSAPDPRQTSAASTSTNVGTAVANAYLGNVNQVTPNGSLTYDQTGSYQWFDPYTMQTYNIPTFTATQTLSPQGQAIQDQNQSAQLNLATIANNQSGFLRDYLGKPADTSNLPGLVGNPNLQTSIGDGYDTNFSRDIGGNFTDSVDLATSYAGADDFSADRAKYEDALWQRGASDRAATEEALRTRLLNSGLREGSAAWNAEMERLGRQNTDAQLATYLAGGQEQARMVELARQAAAFGNDATLAGANFGNNAALQAAQFGSQQQQAQNAAAAGQATFGNNAALQNMQAQNAARSQGMQESYAARNQPINEITALLSGSQVSQPNFVNTNMPQIANTDVAGIINNSYKNQLAQWGANQGASGDLFGGLLGLGGQLIGLSDDDAKKDKEKIGEAKGMGLYEFRYKGEPSSQPKHVGLMASDVQRKKPSAVKRGKDGLRYVDYGKALGLMGAA